MIFDRTYDDVEQAQRLFDEKVKQFIPLTDDEKEIMERGRCTLDTINRIEKKQAELKAIINDMGYFNTPAENYTWSRYDVFGAGQADRLVDNTKRLREAFRVFESTPSLPNVLYQFDALNSIEKNLHDMHIVADEVKLRYRICGTFNTGET
jgi:hypothetical protein